MKYVVSSSVGCTVGQGQRLRLTDAQIDIRRHALSVLDAEKGDVEAHAPLTFKRGEVIDLPMKWDDLDSYFRSVLEPAKGDKPSPEKKPTPTGRAKKTPEALKFGDDANGAGGNVGGLGSGPAGATS